MSFILTGSKPWTSSNGNFEFLTESGRQDWFPSIVSTAALRCGDAGVDDDDDDDDDDDG